MPNTATITTMCPMNCHPTYCGMRISVTDGQFQGLTGDPDNPDSQGFLCVRGRAAAEIPGNPQRLLTPLRCVGARGSGRWEPISWEVAFDTIVSSIKATSPDRVALWSGHGVSVTGIARPLLMRFGHLAGFQVWSPAMVCWALGAYGLGLTGVLETNTKEDLAAHSRTIILWGANLVSQPTTAPHIVAARRRGARVIVIDCRSTEAARHADQVLLIRPGTDAALALAMAHVIIGEGLHNAAFLDQHSLGFEEFASHVSQYSPEWAAAITRISADQIRELARSYATETPAMIVLGGSSIFKHANGWQLGRAIACLPALTGQLGKPGTGFGPRHRGFTRGAGYAALEAAERRPSGSYIPAHMPSIAEAFEQGKIDMLLLFGTNMLSSFANAGAVERGLARTGLVVGTDIFMNETLRRAADIILPGTIWLEELGIKDTATHFYLMDKALEPAGQARSHVSIVRELASRLNVADVFPWADEEDYMNAMLTPQQDAHGQLTVARLRELGGRWERSGLSHVAYPDLRFHTPSGKIEFWSKRAVSVGLPGLPVYSDTDFTDPDAEYPLQLGQGRSISHFHAFYDAGQALPSLAKLNQQPELWVHPQDAQARGLGHGEAAQITNAGGALAVIVHITKQIQPGVVWLHDGHFGLNHLTSGADSIAAEGVGLFDAVRMPGGQSAYHASVELKKC